MMCGHIETFLQRKSILYVYMYNLLHYDDNSTFHTAIGLVLAHLSPVVVQLTAHILILVRCSEFTELGLVLLPLKCDLLLCLGAYALKAYSSWFVCVSDSVSVNPISWGSLKPSTAECITGIVQQYLKLNSLRFLNKALFTVYDMIFSSGLLLGRIPDSPEDKYARIRFPCNLKLGSIQHAQLLAVELRSKQAILVIELNLSGRIVHMHILVSLLGLPNWLSVLGCSSYLAKRWCLAPTSPLFSTCLVGFFVLLGLIYNFSDILVHWNMGVQISCNIKHKTLV